MPSKNDLVADYLKIISDICELTDNNVEFDVDLNIRPGKNLNEIIVPNLVMNKSADYSKSVCGTVNFAAKTVKFKRDITPQTIEKGFEYFKTFVDAFRQEL